MKTIKISIENLNAINDLCKKIGINPEVYDCIDGKLAGKLIMDLSYLWLYHMAEFNSGNTTVIPNPANYTTGGKYDIN